MLSEGDIGACVAAWRDAAGERVDGLAAELAKLWTDESEPQRYVRVRYETRAGASVLVVELENQDGPRVFDYPAPWIPVPPVEPDPEGQV